MQEFISIDGRYFKLEYDEGVLALQHKLTNQLKLTYQLKQYIADQIVLNQDLKPKYTAIYYSHIYKQTQLLKYCLNKLIEDVSSSNGELRIINPLMGFNYEKISGHVDMFTRILEGINLAKTDNILLCEHDVIYNSSYFEFMLNEINKNPTKLIYNTNVYNCNKSGYFISYNNTNLLSNLGGKKDIVIKGVMYKKERFENQTPGEQSEPGKEGEFIQVSAPITVIDVRHGDNFTGYRESPTGNYFNKIDGQPDAIEIKTYI